MTAMHHVGSAIALGCLIGLPLPAIAQIVPDTTLPDNSRVTPGCVQCLIEGGTTHGVNLYHSFREFSVPTNGSAWFNNAPQIQNILTRVTGLTPSSIDGLIRTNGTANLFLLNPNGILFGPNARLQIGGSFWASTADRFQFADGSEFSATNPQAPPLLTLNITPGLQTGTLAGGATITNRGNLAPAQDLTLEGDRLDLQGQLAAGRDLTLKAQTTLQARDSTTTPLLLGAGRNLLVQGNQTIDIFALNHPNSGLFAGGDLVLRSANTVGGDARYFAGGNFRIEQLDGSLGSLYSPKDPIIRSQGDVTFQDYQGASLHILAGGNVTAGAIVITGNDAIADTINPTATPTLATVPLSDGSQVVINGNLRPTLDIRAGMNPTDIGTPLGTSGYTLAPTEIFGVFVLPFLFPVAPPANTAIASGSNIQVDLVAVTQPNGQVLLTNQFRPNLNLPNGSITVNNTSVLGPGGIYVNSNSGNGGDIAIDARGSLRLNGSLNASSLPAVAGALPPANAGTITLLAGGDLTPAPNTVIAANGLLGGRVTLNSGGTLALSGGRITSVSSSPVPGVGGAINLAARSLVLTNGAQITTQTTQQARGGDITVNAPQINVQSGGQLFTLTSGPGQAGNLAIAGDVIELTGTNATGTVASSFGANSIGAGNAGQLTVNTRQLRVREGAQIGAGTFGSGNGGKLTVTAADIQVSGQGAIGRSGLFTSTNPGASGNAGALDITTDSLLVSDRALLAAGTDGAGRGGDFAIRANQVSVQTGAQILANTNRSGTGGNLTVQATTAVQVSGKDSTISTRSGVNATGRAGTLAIQTNALTIRAGAQVDSATFGPGAGGAVVITADTVETGGTSGDGQVASGLFAGTNSTLPNGGAGGSLSINARQVVVREGSGISVATEGAGAGGNLAIAADTLVVEGGIVAATRGTGAAGNVTLTPRSSTALTLQFQNDGQIAASTSSQGAGGSIAIAAPQAVTITGDGEILAGTRSSGRGGSVNLATQQLTVQNGAKISASTGGLGAGGNIDVVAPDSVVVSNAEFASETSGLGDAGNVAIATGQFTLQAGGAVTTSTRGPGRGGNIGVDAARGIDLVGAGSTLLATTGLGNAASQGSAAPGQTGQAGTIRLKTAGQLSIQQGAEVSVSSGQLGGGAGDVAIAAGSATLGQGGRVSSNTAGAGAAGNLIVQIADQLNLSGQGTGLFASTTPGSSGNGGSIRVEAGRVQIENKAAIAVDSQGSGTGGSISIQTNRLELNRQGSITAETASSQGGNIALEVSELILLRRNSLISATAGNAQAGGDGGNITIRTPFIIGVLGENSDITANAFSGRGGNITITTNAIFGLLFQPRLTPFSDITASSQFGLNGTVTLNTLNVDPNRGLVALPANLVDPANQIAASCAPRRLGQRTSEFVVVPGVGIPEGPGEMTTGGDRALVPLTDLMVSPQTAVPQFPGAADSGPAPTLVEAQGWMQTADGTVVLVSRAPEQAEYAIWRPTVSCGATGPGRSPWPSGGHP